jgi:hypothetical protein
VRPAYKIIERSHHLADIYVYATSFHDLQDILEGHRTISKLTKLLRRIPVVRALRQLALALLVDPLVVEHQHEKADDTCADEPKFEGMSEDIARCIFSAIEVGSHGSCEIAHGDLDGLACGALGGASQI